MKIHSLGLLSLLALCMFQRAAALPKYAGAGSDWTQFLPAQRRAVVSDGEDSADPSAQEFPPQQLPVKLSPNPMNPFLTLKPFLPVKPTFMPPFVDPQIFIDKKTALLNSLFSSPALAGTSSPADASPPPNPLIWLPAASPNYFASKKTQFLNTLFSNLAVKDSAPAGAQTVKRDLSEIGQVSEPAVSADSTVYSDKKTDFLQKLFAALNLTSPEDDAGEVPVTPKPTIVPPNFWIPFPSPQPSLPRVPLTKTPPAVDPNFFVDKKTKFLNTLFSNLAIPPKSAPIPPTKAPIVPADYWIPPGKPNPAILYQQKVSEFLNKLFTSLNVSSDAVNVSARNIDSLLSEGKENSNDPHTVSVKTRFVGPPVGAWGPPPLVPTVNPKIFIDKKTAFLNKLFTSLSTPPVNDAVPVNSADDASPLVKPTIVPPNFWSPFASDSGDIASGPATVKPTIVPPNFWSPFASASSENDANGFPTPAIQKPVPAVDPSAYINNKAQFLNNLFNSLGLPPKTVVTTPAPTAEIAIDNDNSSIDNSVLAEFLQKLLQTVETPESLSKRNNDHNSGDASEEIQGETDLLKRALDSSNSVDNPLLVAKDKVVNSIITELSGIKDEMMTTVDEILQQKKEPADGNDVSPSFPSFGMKSPFTFGGGKMYGAGMKGGAGKKGATTATADSKKKSAPAFGSKFPFWMPTAKPTPDPTIPLQERLDFLSQVFEMLTKLQKDVSLAVNQAASESVSHTTPTPISDEDSLLKIMKNLMAQGKNSTKSKFGSKIVSRAIDPVSDALQSHPNSLTPNAEVQKKEDAKTRSIKMAVHQGYQSLPPGTEEIIESGGGSEADDHEGGGLKLQIKVPV